MPSKLKKAIGAVKDQTSISLAKVASNNSSNLEVVVLKATTHDDVPMEERHVAEILHLVSSNKAHAAACARAIGKRIGRTRNWIVAIKSLMLVLRIFQDGDPYFPREVLHAMKRGAKILNLSSFRDDSNSSPWDYTAFIRTFALYLDERLDCFLTGKLQRRYKHTEKEPTHRRSKSRQANEPVHDMKPAMLLDKISYWQRLLDRAVATRPTGAAKTNRLVQIALYAIVQETFDLYKDISDGLALLLDSFFHLQYNSCVNAFQACVKATKQFEELGTFYDLCKSIGVGRTSEYPSVQKISEELIETLQEFLKDQTSFPSTGRSPSRPQLLLPAPTMGGSVSRRRHESVPSFTQSEFSEAPTEWTVSDHGSQCTSLEDLISATELMGASPSISIDLEAYSLADKIAKDSRRDDLFGTNDDAGSTRSLPISSSIADFVSFEEWPDDDDDEGDESHPQPEQHQQQPKADEIFDWELVVAEPGTKPAQPFNNGFDPFANNTHESKQLATSDSKKGWELVLAESATATTASTEVAQPVLAIDNLFQPSVTPQDQYYNPFLQDLTELTAIVPTTNAGAGGGGATFPATDGFSAAPTFQAAAPTFCAQKPEETGNDPFEAFHSTGGGQGASGTMNQQEWLQQQQLWLQQQNKIIAKHIM